MTTISDPSGELHPVDAAVALQTTGDGSMLGAMHPAWNNMVGPFGGITAATALNAVLKHPALLGTPVSLTVNYASAIAPGPFTLRAEPARTNRSTQHWTIMLMQANADGKPEVALTGTAVTAARRGTWSADDLHMPDIPPADGVKRFLVPGVEWVNRFDLRIVEGALPTTWEGQGDASRTRMWLRDVPPRPVDHLALASLADAFYPRVWLRRAQRVPAGTVSMTVYFHADAAALERTGTGWLLGQAQAQGMHNGFFDQKAELWNEAGDLLVTSHQIVYYKE
ncbi:acyl-CoA thioesterase [Variovorax sp. VNK109]|uniref:acyl-CoA thioesterase n=1 Tax=Variovorax sp. VNK109 TaxID=3400919 RepID=UPI003C06CE35